VTLAASRSARQAVVSRAALSQAVPRRRFCMARGSWDKFPGCSQGALRKRNGAGCGWKATAGEGARCFIPTGPLLADALQGGRPLLHKAVEEGDVRSVQALLEAGADKEAGDDQGLTPLHKAVSHGHAAVVETLLAAGSDTEARSKGSTPLHAAASHGHAVVAEKLLAAGADVEARDEKGLTPLLLAAVNGHAAGCGGSTLGGGAAGAVVGGHAAVVEQLLAAGADREVTSKSGRTALHQAAMMGRAAQAETLLAAGADTEATDQDGLTPLDVAVKYRRGVVAKLLRDNHRKSF